MEYDSIANPNYVYRIQLPHGGNRAISHEELEEISLNPVHCLPELNGKKTWVSNYVGTFWSHIMKPNCFAVYFQLMKLAYGDKDYAFPSISYLGLLTNMSDRTVQRCLRTLIELNFVVVIQVREARTLENKPNLYLLSNTIPFISTKQYESLPLRLQKEHDEFMKYIKKRKLLKEDNMPNYN